ncbi:MAG TPA: hypothetical protein DCZ04_16685 [Syntrophorhabdus aromaticivorans]|nr:hypothetical protein [Syntrophorhabdus aromaticivorans]
MGNIASIDPGISGAISVLDKKSLDVRLLVDMPVIKIAGRDVLDIHEVIRTLKSYNLEHVYLEQSLARPSIRKNGEKVSPGIVSVGSYMKNYGMLVGICATLGVRYTEVLPQTWKKKMMAGMSKEKGASIIRAAQLFPQISFERKKDHHKADSLLIGYYGIHAA